jgi:hypothetical protein
MKKFLLADVLKAADVPDYIQMWRDNGYPEDFIFSIRPSSGTRPGTMAKDPAEVNAYPIYESIGADGNDTPYYYVDVNWPKEDTNAKYEKAYEMDIDTIESWSNDTSGSYFNDNIKGKYAPRG